ncbi:hypothetical protein CY658_24295 [Variovorax sp. RO1]|uniref:DUF1643 domain-containing protein n=1 Tax=Variovorax sp. RO1 TaxID=2066034 RepID=UPI000C716EA0|nr:DUF1643 domain-containing protein [Variovorax sp. RO1]PLC03015.1 hypothetical protein CY658_24295 [Variovorax sp. RO1]
MSIALTVDCPLKVVITKRDALFSADRKHRLWLYREWDATKPVAAFIGFNPSIAGVEEDDPTIRKLVGFASRFGCGSLFMVNPYSFIATRPKDLKAAGYPTGGLENDTTILSAAKVAQESGGFVICCWGQLAKGLARPVEIARRVSEDFIPLYTLGHNRDGSPAHPPMLAYGERTRPYRWSPA